MATTEDTPVKVIMTGCGFSTESGGSAYGSSRTVYGVSAETTVTSIPAPRMTPWKSVA